MMTEKANVSGTLTAENEKRLPGSENENVSGLELHVLRPEDNNYKKDIKRFIGFRHRLYKNDPFYSPCAEFTFEMLLNRTTEFAENCECVPVFVTVSENAAGIPNGSNKDNAADLSEESTAAKIQAGRENDNPATFSEGCIAASNHAVLDNDCAATHLKGKNLAEALVIYNPGDDFVQLGFFEALPGQKPAADMIVRCACEFGRQKACRRLIIGLNGHLSYGVGLSADMKEPNTFDSTYSKTYYCDYFAEYSCHTLTSYISDLRHASSAFPDLKTKGNISVRCVDMKHFKEECDVFSELCNETIGTTFLFSKTGKNHFYELLEPMLFFLEKQNILFAYSGEKPVGFLFWHPDYNEILPKGRQASLPEIALRFVLFKKKIRKVKLNSMGVLPEYRVTATYLLLKEMKKNTAAYERVETNFVWDNNVNSTLLNRALLGEKARTFKVFEVNI